MDNIRNIIFDLGGVILDIDFARTQQAFIDLGVSNFDELYGFKHIDSFFRQHETGQISDEEFMTSLQKMSGHPLERTVIEKAWNALLIRFPPERIELLKDLKKRYRLFLLSNTNAIHVVEFQKIYSNTFNSGRLADLFEKVYYSNEVGMRKPNVEIYEFVLKDSHLVPEETVFIDDSLPNVEGANQAGIKAIHLKPGQTILDLFDLRENTIRN